MRGHSSYLARFRTFHKFERVAAEENRLSTFVAAESDNREIVSVRGLAGHSAEFGAASSEVRSSESKAATIFKHSISLRTRANSACFCCKTSYTFCIALLQKTVALRSVHLHLLSLNPRRHY